MVLTGSQHASNIGGSLTSEEVQADGVMGRFSLFPWWKAGGRCKNHEVCVVGIATSLLHFVLIGIELETPKTPPSKYC